MDEDAGGNPPGPFEQHYTKETRTALPAMQLTTVRPVATLFEQAGFGQVTVGDLGSVHALADDPPSSRPWYVLVARRPSQRQAAPDG